MLDFIAVKNKFDFTMPNGDLSQILKREAIILDKMAVLYLDDVFKDNTISDDTKNDLSWLQESGYLYEKRTPEKTTKQLSEEFYWYKDYADELYEVLTKTHPHVKTNDIKLLFSSAIIMTQLDTRALCFYLREVEHLDATYSFSHFCNPLLDLEPQDVLSITIKHLPIIDETVPWEQIIYFKSDPDSRSKFLALRNWIGEVSKNKLTPVETKQKLEYLLDQYQQHMKLHKMKTNAGVLQTFIIATAEVLGDLVSFKWGKAAEALFSLKNRKAALLEGELKAPGNEVAYIIKAQESFKDQDLTSCNHSN